MDSKPEDIDDSVPTMEEAFADYVPSKPLPEEHELDDTRCHNCGTPWDDDEWDVRHINTPNIAAETWYYECPGCKEEVFEVGI